MLTDFDHYEQYRKDLDGKVISGKAAGGDYEFQFSRPKNRQGEFCITRLSTREKFKTTLTLIITDNKCNVKISLDDLPDDLKLEFNDIKGEMEYNTFIDSLEDY